MRTPHAAMYARVASEQQAMAHTSARQVAALQARGATDGLARPERRPFLDEGYRGATLVRPALERLRDLIATGAGVRLYGPAPDRLARQYAYQVLLGDEFPRMSVEVIFLHRALGRSPEDDVLLQGPGMRAEYARATIVERHRRGQWHAARAGAVHGLSGAPSGYRYVDQHGGGGQARDARGAAEARGVRQLLTWVGEERLTIGEVCRRLIQAQEVTRTGQTVWERRVVWGLLKNPAYMGAAAFGKTRQGPRRPRLRAPRGRPWQPRRAVAVVAVPAEDWMAIPVPALVATAVLAAVPEQ